MFRHDVGQALAIGLVAGATVLLTTRRLKKTFKGWLGFVVLLSVGGLTVLIVADLVMDEDSCWREWWAARPLFANTLTGALLLGGTFLVVQAVLDRVAGEPWEKSRRTAARLVLAAGRRGGHPVNRLMDDKRRDPKALLEAVDELLLGVDRAAATAAPILARADEAHLWDLVAQLVEEAGSLAARTYTYAERTDDNYFPNVEKHWRDVVLALRALDEAYAESFGEELTIRREVYPWAFKCDDTK